MSVTANRYHDICCGHRVFGHENKCAHLHGHNYRFHFEVKGEKDSIGRVLDFSVIKSRLCQWLEENWDHKFLLWEQDTFWHTVVEMNEKDKESFIVVPFNPTAENIAEYFVEQIAPKQLEGTGAVLVRLTIEETRKCSATYERE